MSREHFPSLREQLIKSLGDKMNDYKLAEKVFDECLWPVLDKAMTAGEFLVARNTVPQMPVHAAITDWLIQVIAHVEMLKGNEAIISKAKLLSNLKELAENAEMALVQARSIVTLQTPVVR